MDSPGNVPFITDVAWVGTTACAPQNCIIEWPQQHPWPQWVNPHAPAVPYVAPVQPHTHYRFSPVAAPVPLSDADVDRIARRLAEILREAKP